MYPQITKKTALTSTPINYQIPDAEMLLICSTHHLRFASLASNGEIEQIFGNIHPSFADLAKLDEYCRLSCSNGADIAFKSTQNGSHLVHFAREIFRF